MGADETLGGYARHRRTFTREGFSGLQREVEKDFCRLWSRNLGRDDRVVADHGREGRYPFLDEGVIGALTSVAEGGKALHEVMDVRLGEGVGEKKLLRTCARLIGLRDVSRLQKRAIQFGTRVANRKMCGSQVLADAAGASTHKRRRIDPPLRGSKEGDELPLSREHPSL
jgi:asparagine synthetase B (glutamine-hydrolysing)